MAEKYVNFSHTALLFIEVMQSTVRSGPSRTCRITCDKRSDQDKVMQRHESSHSLCTARSLDIKGGVALCPLSFASRDDTQSTLPLIIFLFTSQSILLSSPYLSSRFPSHPVSHRLPVSPLAFCHFLVLTFSFSLSRSSEFRQ